MVPEPIQQTLPETPAASTTPPEQTPEAQPEQPASSSSPMDLLAKLLRGESVRHDGS
jgi:hypothetical protein